MIWLTWQLPIHGKSWWRRPVNRLQTTVQVDLSWSRMDVTTPRNTTCPLPQSTPFKTGTAILQPFTMNQKFCIQIWTEMAAEIKNHLLGPMSTQAFLDSFLPKCSLRGLAQLPAFTQGCYTPVTSSEMEHLAYHPFVGLSSPNKKKL
jgi:hypothetical protein